MAFDFYSDGILSNVTIERNSGSVIVFLHTHRPGVIIGEKSSQLDKFKAKVFKSLGINIKVNITEVYKPEASPQFICDQVVKQLVNRGDYKRTAKNCIKFAMKSSIVKGILIFIGGRLGGASIARIEKFRKGSVAMQTFRDKIIYCNKQAKTIFGICGVKVFVSYNNNYVSRDVSFNDFKNRGYRGGSRNGVKAESTESPVEQGVENVTKS